MKNKRFEPFLLKPVGKDYIWGGNRLKTEYNKDIDLEPLAETWECSIHPDGTSIVASGEFNGITLDKVIKENPKMIGTHAQKFGQFPILIKFIDAKKNLSVQVHPSDEYAKKYENNSLGKTEMWYVLDATDNAELIYGFNKDLSKEELKKILLEGKILEYLQKVKIKKGDVFFIPSGQVHAIGAGTVIAEIQKNSNLTYRLYDYDRVDKNGNKRELHIDKAIDVVNLSNSKTSKQKSKELKLKNGYASELLCKCKYFKVKKLLLNTENCSKMVSYKTNRLSFHVLLCIDGYGLLYYNDKTLKFNKGDCIFIPANSTKIKFHGKASMLDVNS